MQEDVKAKAAYSLLNGKLFYTLSMLLWVDSEDPEGGYTPAEREHYTAVISDLAIKTAEELNGLSMALGDNLSMTRKYIKDIRRFRKEFKRGRLAKMAARFQFEVEVMAAALGQLSGEPAEEFISIIIKQVEYEVYESPE